MESGNILSPAEQAANANHAGPYYNQVTCDGCHLRDGRGLPPDAGSPTQTLVIKVFGAGTDAHGLSLPDASYGKQLQDKATSGLTPEGSATVQWTPVDGQLADGTAYTLQRPSVQFLDMAAGPPRRYSVRLPRQLIGMGLLEAIPEADLLARGVGLLGLVERVGEGRRP